MRTSFVTEHPWMTFFLGLAIVNGVVIAVRGYEPPIRIQLPPLAGGPWPNKPPGGVAVRGERGVYR